MREYLTLHRSVFPSYLTIESGRIENIRENSECNLYHTEIIPEYLRTPTVINARITEQQHPPPPPPKAGLRVKEHNQEVTK